MKALLLVMALFMTPATFAAHAPSQVYVQYGVALYGWQNHCTDDFPSSQMSQAVKNTECPVLGTLTCGGKVFFKINYNGAYLLVDANDVVWR